MKPRTFAVALGFACGAAMAGGGAGCSCGGPTPKGGAGGGATPSDASSGTDSANDAQGIDAGPPLCDPLATWGAPQAVPGGPAAGDILFGSMAPDERTLAWVSPSTGGDSVVSYAERNDATSAFGTARDIQKADIPDNLAADRAALSADGLRLVVIKTGPPDALLEVTRATRADPFAIANTAPFAQIDSPAGPSLLGAGRKIGDAIVSRDDLRLYVSLFKASSTATVATATRASSADPWVVLAFWDQDELNLAGTQRRKPTGVSEDRRTLFYWDEVSGTQKGAWRLAESLAFTQFADFGNKRGITPNAACTRLYFGMANPGGGGSALFFIEKQ